MKVLCVFGSASDEPVFGPLCKALGTEPVICSAHRDPSRLSRIIQSTDAEIIVAGAGLAAHLPGVIASQTMKPVIGVPVAANMDGLDSLLSIMQMPPGIPVLCSGVNATDSIIRFLKALPGQKGIRFSVKGAGCENALAKAEEMKNAFGIPDGSLPITFFPAGNPQPGDGINVICGSLPGKDAPKLLAMTTRGLFVGLNRGENAVIMAAQLLHRAAESKPLIDYREKMKVR
ncbi:MAG: AIR carboxylase family protein [Nanoarchaeota archaeon]